MRGRFKRWCWIILLSLGLASLPQGVRADTVQPPSIRVLLDQGLPQVSFRVIQGGYVLLDEQGKEIARPAVGETWEARVTDGKLFLVRQGQTLPQTFTGVVELRPQDEKAFNLFLYQGNRYRGSLKIFLKPEGLATVNTLDLEQYLYGVVGPEMAVSTGTGEPGLEEALKAQAVVSRSYALSCLGSGGYYDVTDDTYTQVYRGYEAELVPGADKVKKAVDATRGQVIYYEGKLVKAYFHSNAGGYTEDSENVWSEAFPYLRGVPSPEDEYALRFGGWVSNTYSWSKTLTREEVQGMIKAWLERTGETAELGDIIDLIPSQERRDGNTPTISGRVTRLEVVGTKGKVTAYRDRIRSVLGLRSTLFTLEMDSTVTVLDGQGRKNKLNYAGELKAVGVGGELLNLNGPASEYAVTGAQGTRMVPKMFQRVLIQGRGYGHGLGLSQWGARGMAAKGFSYRDIIEHYYNQGKYDGKLTIGLYTRNYK